MAKQKHEMKVLDNRGKLHYVIADNIAEILQISPWVMTESFIPSLHGMDAIDMGDLAIRLSSEIGFEAKSLGEKFLDLQTIGEIIDAVEQVLPTSFVYGQLEAPDEVPVL